MSDKKNPKDKIGQTKLPLTVVPPSAILYMAEAMNNGAEKYGRFNWRHTNVRSSIYIDATFRHLYAWLDGEEKASDSNISHLAHAMASLAVLVDAIECGTIQDDRPWHGQANKILERYQIEKNVSIMVEENQKAGLYDDVQKQSTSGIVDLWELWKEETDEKERESILDDMEDIIKSARQKDKLKWEDSSPSVKRTKANSPWEKSDVIVCPTINELDVTYSVNTIHPQYCQCVDCNYIQDGGRCC